MDTPFPPATPVSPDSPDSPDLPPPDLRDRYCIQCAYHLAGLPITGPCPECGTPVELSFREPTLANASPVYLDALKSGLTLVLNSILVTVAISIIALILVFSIGPSPAFNIIAEFFVLALSAVGLLGYWLFTQPDPSQVALEKTSSARAIVRITVITGAALAALSFMATLAGSTLSSPNALAIASGLSGIFSIVEFVTAAVLFFGVLRYSRWLATRIPDEFLLTRSKRYMWLLPLLYTVGALALFLGPLIALVLYWNFLNRLRTHIRSIIASGLPANLKGRARLST